MTEKKTPKKKTSKKADNQEQGIQPSRASWKGTTKTDKTSTELKPSRASWGLTGEEQDVAEEQRQAELAEERRVHNERTGDASR